MNKHLLTCIGSITCHGCGHEYIALGGQILYPCPKCHFLYNMTDETMMFDKVRSLRLIYLASPYSARDSEPECVEEQRYEAACEFAAYLIKQGKHVYSPIAHTHPIAVIGKLRTGWSNWADYDLLMISRCDEFVILKLEGWKESKGIEAETEIALKLGKPIIYMNPLPEESNGED